jgi:hypothetical protein
MHRILSGSPPWGHEKARGLPAPNASTPLHTALPGAADFKLPGVPSVRTDRAFSNRRLRLGFCATTGARSALDITTRLTMI